jgi:hypothetical protein
MPLIDRDQLELLKRQIDDEYRLDMAAIERLQRRFGNHNPGSSLPPQLAAQPVPLMIDTPAVPLASLESLAPSQPDDLTGSLRAMFSNTLRK